ncbi:OFA family MFS transporter [Methanogenium sp. MK-MG]|uniref:L-lactate MFS transporter n=1 Tax=Methanogenium sp. MK-MG TaxID=2599926 RepID=UPI0020B17863|nr:OFA family MFS transporter [Methanogenium sp. MK-MG]KAF1078327.1 hypothetical protein MKMG_00738 [Methanogenium sp. MK-MG]
MNGKQMSKADRPAVMVAGMDAVRGRWALVGIGFLINLCLGSIYSWSVFVGPLAAHYTGLLGREVTTSEVLFPFSVFLACFALAMPLAGKFIDTHGPRAAVALGGLLTGLGWLSASVAPSVWMLYLMYGVVGGAGVGIAYGVPVAVASRWFPDRRGLAVGVTVAGFGMSALVTATVAGYLLETAGVMMTFRIFGIAFAAVLLLCAVPLRFPPDGWRPPGWQPPAVDTERNAAGDGLGQMLRSRRFYGLWICYFIGCCAGLMAISIAKPVGTEVVGITGGLATLLVAFFAIFNGGGRPVFGCLTDRLHPGRTAAISFLMIGGASLAMWAAPTVPVYIVSFAILWGCLGGWLAIAPTATATYFGTADYPRMYGLVFLAYGAGALVGPQLAGFIRTATGSWTGVFPYVAVMAAVGCLIALTLLRKE